MMNANFEIQEGDIRSVRRVEPANYWDDPAQLSKPASDEQVQAFLKSKEDKQPVWLKRLLIAVVVLAVLIKIFV